MSKAIAFLAIVSLVPLPQACNKLLHKDAEPAPTPVASAEIPIPDLSATTPPIYHAPEEAPMDTAVASTPAPSAELTKARAAADAKDWKKVRALLDKRVHGGKASNDEAGLMFRACRELKDKACVDYVHKAYPHAT